VDKKSWHVACPLAYKKQVRSNTQLQAYLLSVLVVKPISTHSTMRDVYEDPGATALLFAALHLRDLARLEFMLGNDVEGLFLSQLSVDLRRIAAGSPPRCPKVWPAVAAQSPNAFSPRVAA
jgi:hypothetical protein